MVEHLYQFVGFAPMLAHAQLPVLEIAYDPALYGMAGTGHVLDVYGRGVVEVIGKL